MNSDGRNVLMTDKGTNTDIVTAIRQVFEQYWQTAAPFVRNLAVCDFATQCQSVFWYVAKNIRYQQDEGNRQLIKTPARLADDGVGDCKSMAIFCASCLYCLGAKVTFRFVTFNRDYTNYTHVYCVASKDGQTYIVDPVERINQQPVFNYASKYVTKRDLTYTA